ncbi:hypothetical protein MKW92_029933, partial [Papaver armeniacum]
MSGPIFNFLMTRRIYVPQDEDIWFRFCNGDFSKEICFGKRQFAAISGLSFTKTDARCALPARQSKLKEKYFWSDGK